MRIKRNCGGKCYKKRTFYLHPLQISVISFDLKLKKTKCLLIEQLYQNDRIHKVYYTKVSPENNGLIAI